MGLEAIVKQRNAYTSTAPGGDVLIAERPGQKDKF
jgi:hypothetical protein